MTKMTIRGAVTVAVLASTSVAGATVQVSALELGGGTTMKPSVLLQAWTLGNENDSSRNQAIRLRRAEIKVTGKIAGAPKYFLMIDPAKLIPAPGAPNIAAKNMLQDFGLSYAIVPELELTVGQFKAPTAAEGLDSSGDLPLPERSLVGRTIGDKREMGIRAAYKTTTWNAATMLSSGRAVSATGEGMANDLHTRVEATPVEGLGVGTFLTLGEFDYSTKGRFGLNGRYRLGDADLRAEYARSSDKGVPGEGVTTEAGYWVTENLEPVARYEMFRPNPGFISASKAQTLGVNYYLRDYNTKLQLAGTAMQNMAAPNGSPSASKGVNNKVVTFVVQASL